MDPVKGLDGRTYEPQYLARTKKLNRVLLTTLRNALDESLLYDLRPTLQSYITAYNSIEANYSVGTATPPVASSFTAAPSQPAATHISSGFTFSPQKRTAPSESNGPSSAKKTVGPLSSSSKSEATAFSLGSTAPAFNLETAATTKPATFSFGLPPAVTSAAPVPKPSFSFAPAGTSTPASKPTFNFGTPASNTTPTGPAFGGFKFGDAVSAAPLANSTPAVIEEDDEDDEPPVPEEIGAMNDPDSFFQHEIQLKYREKGGDLKGKGDAVLFLKPSVTTGGPPQLLIRAKNQLKTILLNVNLDKKFPIKQAGKASVSFITTPNPPLNTKEMEGVKCVNFFFTCNTKEESQTLTDKLNVEAR